MRHKFLALDGLRGLSCFAVLLFHQRDHFGGDGFFGHAYLAVDFFFILSGFVIEHAYGLKLMKRGAAKAFLVDRAIRLYPLIFLSAIMGAISIFIKIRAGQIAIPRLPILTFVSAFVPFPAVWLTPNFFPSFPLNAPVWSLFWEICINIAYAFAARWCTTSRLWLLLGISAAVMIALSFYKNGLGLIGYPGSVRVVFSFSAGILLHRLLLQKGQLKLCLSELAAGTILLVVFISLPTASSLSKFYDPFCVFFVFPAVVYFSASSAVSLPRLAAVLGALSFPLYVLQEPIFSLVNVIFSLMKIRQAAIQGICGIAASVIVASLAWKFYDLPVTSLLRSRFGSSRHRARLSIDEIASSPAADEISFVRLEP